MFSMIRQILSLSGKHKARLYAAFVLNFFESVFMNVPVILILFVLRDIASESFNMERIRLYLLIMVGALILQAVFKYFVYRLQSATGFVIMSEERMRIGDLLQRLPMGYFSDTNVGSVAATVTTDLSFIETYSMQFISKIISAVFGAVIAAGFVFLIDVRMALIALIAYPVCILLHLKVQGLFKRYGHIRQQAQSSLVSNALEYIQGIAVIKAFNMKGEKAARFDDAVKNFETAALEFEMKAVPWLAGFNISFQIGSALILFFGPYFYFAGTLNIASLLMFIIISFRIYIPLEGIAAFTGILRLMGVCLDRVEVINNTPLLDERDTDQPVKGHEIEFKNVSFAYENREVIRDVSFVIPENTMTALVGASGSGKSTIANLTGRFWDVQKGEVLIGGTNIKNMKCDSVLSHISIVFQSVYLFHDTVFNNIAFGKPGASREEVIEASKMARCHEFIEELENGYDTIVGEGGGTLSGGEKQRISIARAILKDAPIIILDEAIASVDPENERLIQEAINTLVKNKTLIVIAHRLSTIRGANQILVIEDGAVAERGTHEQLLDADGIYADYWHRRQKARSWTLTAKQPAESREG